MTERGLYVLVWVAGFAAGVAFGVIAVLVLR